MLQPTQADLDARERARAAGRALAAAPVHAPTAEDTPADSGASVAHVEILRLDADESVGVATGEGVVTVPLDPTPDAAAPAPAPAPQPAPAVHAMKPLPGGLPTAVWLVQLAKYHGCSVVGPAGDPHPAEAEGQHIVTWTANDADTRALFPTASAARAFQLDAMEGASVSVIVWNAAHHPALEATATPESASPAAEDGPAGTTGPENTGDGSTGRKTGFTTFGLFEAVGPAADLAQRMGAFQGGDLFRAPARKPEHFRVTWRDTALPVGTFADFESEAVADNLAQYLQRGDAGETVRGISLEGDLEQDGDVALSIGGVSLDLDGLLRQAMLAELKRTYRQLNRVRWWALAGWLTAACTTAAAVATAVALRGYIG